MKQADLKAGTLLHVTGAASVQFHRPIIFRLIRIVEGWTRTTYDGWIWIEGYQLDHQGNAVEKRTLFVMLDGLRVLESSPTVPKSRKAASRTRQH